MKVDSKRIRQERLSKAWSQEHMAAVTGLGLRTIQRIENAGGASHESIAAIASVLDIPVEQLIAVGEFRRSLADVMLSKRLWVLLACVFVTTLVTPPELTLQMAVLAGLWFGFELFVAVVRWKGIHF